jgi:Trk K+ transport system NAD-binding subunit
MAIPGAFPGEGELVEFETEDEPKWMTVKLKDGSVIQIKMEIVAIMRNGNDMNTGLPLYMVQATNIIRVLKVPKELISKRKAEDSKGQSLYR